jgi:hypothetical protein
MDKRLPVVVALAFIVTACASEGGPRGYRPFGVGLSSVVSVSVDVIDDRGEAYIVVSQEPIYVQQSNTNAIYWSLPSTGPYYFSNTPQDPGIKFDTPMPNTRCDYYNGDSRTYFCTYNRANKTKYPYVIRVKKDGSPVIKSDPTVMNN